jgi:uncharacterized membrane protein
MRVANTLRWAAGLAAFFIFAPLAHPAARQVLSGRVPAAVADSQPVGRLPAGTKIKLAVGLPLRNPQQLESLLQRIADPASPEYRHYLTPAEFAERFGPSEEDYQTLQAYVEANGFTITATHPNRTILDVSGTVAAIENAFQVEMRYWNHPARGTFFAPDRDPSIDAGVTVLDISGLDNFTLPRPMNLQSRPLASATPLTSGSGPGGLFIGKDFRAAYAPAVTLNGAGQTIGLFELDGFYAADVAANFQQAGLAAVPVETVLLDGFNGQPGGGNVEVTLDIMMASYMAPGASKIIVYEGENPNDVLNRMATDNLAHQLSSSWGWSPTDALTEQAFKQMIAQGQALFQASGDDGAYHGGVMPPSDDPNLTVVGGTSLTTTGSGGAWQSESAWSGSGGGVSTVWPIPSYQQGTNVAAAGGSPTMRNIPDVSLIADIQIFLICNNGQWIEVGGTSAAAPLWAGFIALANQQAAANKNPVIGFVNPAIYAIGNGTSYTSDLHDIVTGSNGFSALPGYDLATGWGTPAGQALINSLTSTSNSPGFSLSASASTLTVAPGASVTSTITVSPQQGFSGAVNLSVSGLPAGVTASFSPASATASSILTVVASSSTAGSTSTLTISGASGTVTNTARVTLTVAGTPSFNLSATPASLNVVRAKSVTSSITITPQGGFQGKVTLSASGLPAGVTASFSTVNATSTSTLTLTASSSAALGASTITITGVSGALSSTANVSLTVSAAPTPNFSIAASPASLGINAGASGASSITVTPQNGFTASVSFSISGLPAGVTAAFSPAASTRSTSVTIKAAANAAPGSATLTVTGVSGALTSSATIVITVVVPPSFTLSATPAALNLTAGTSGASTIAVNAQNGFNGTVKLAASGLPAGVTATFSSMTVTFTASSAAAAGNATATITGTSGSLSASTSIALSIAKPPSFTLSLSPSALSIAAGGSGNVTLTLTPHNGFSSPILLSVSGVPGSVTPSFTANSATIGTLTFQASPAAPAGSSTVTITAKAGTLSQTVTLALTITAATGASGGVSLTGAYNVMGAVADGAQFLSSSGLDGGGRAYSASLLGTVRTAGGVAYNFGPANAPGAVSGGTIALPAGKYSSLLLLASGVNGNQTSQKFVVTYTDGSTTSLTQSLSDWCSPQNYAGESNAISMSYRDLSNGARDTRTVMLYGYTLNLSASKTVRSLTLPSNRNVVIMAIALGGATTSVADGPGITSFTFTMRPERRL